MEKMLVFVGKPSGEKLRMSLFMDGATSMIVTAAILTIRCGNRLIGARGLVLGENSNELERCQLFSDPCENWFLC
jgi:hypothetical protein